MNSSVIGGQKRDKSKSLTLTQWCSKHTKAFFSQTYLHGLPFMARSDLCIWEKGFFSATFLVCITFALYQSLYVFDRWQNTPVIIGIESHSTSITEMPFPTITICNMNQLKADRVSKFKNDTLDYAMTQYICLKDPDFRVYRNITRRPDQSLLRFLLHNAQTCAEMFVRCKYDSVDMTCTDIFREVITDEGLCCIFNTMHPDFLFKGEYYFIRQYTITDGYYETPVFWHPETGYDKVLPRSYYPLKVGGLGVSRGLSIVLNANIKNYYCSSTNGPGFKVLLYNPIDEPNMRDTGLPLMIGRQSKVRIRISGIKASPTVRGITPRRRQCSFADEQQLLFYKLYTRRNCERECEALYFFRRCHCIPFYLPLIYPNASYCFVQHFNCVRRYEQIVNDTIMITCRRECLPSCFDVSYYPDMFVTPFDVYDMQDDFLKNYSKDYARENLAIAHFYYQDIYYRNYVKRTYTGTTEYLSLTGGIMSLMIGFSVISFVELIYFYIFHPFSQILARRALRKKVSPSANMETDRFEQHYHSNAKNPFRNRSRRLPLKK